jgi:two-component system, NtrC family, response regulator
MAHVLIVDDERDLCNLVARLLRERGHTTQCVYSGESALQAAGECQPDLVLLDLHLDGTDGIETLPRLRASVPGAAIVMVTAFGSVQAAVKAMKLGATDFVSKPFNNQALLSTVDKLLATRRESDGEAPSLVGESSAFRRALELALKFAVPDVNVLLAGETGTGKELFARRIHAASKRRSGPFVAVDCSMLAETLLESELFGHEKGAFTGATAARRGRLELAQGGTLFLDEIGNLPVEFQAKLLRVLQERRIERVGGRKSIQLDVRVLSATNVNLKEAIRAGAFRQDLYYRLQGVTICLPPLRERNGDIHRLADHLLAIYARSFGASVRGFSERALELLESYAWPGNVRELENAIKSAVVMAGDVVLPEHLPAEICDHPVTRIVANADSEQDAGEGRLRLEIDVELEAAEIDLKALGAQAAELAERSLLRTLVRRGRMSGAQMARRLGVDPKTLRTKLRRYGLDPRLVTEEEQPAKGRILVVDDQPDMCWVLARLLSERGHEVRTARDGTGALAALANFECQVAVVDYRLPDSDGVALITQLTERLPRLRAILMSSYGSATLRQRATDEVLFAYLDKPFDNNLMLDTIEDAVRAGEAGDDSLAKGSGARTRFPGRELANP